MKRSIIGRSDLLEILTRKNNSRREEQAKLLGYELQQEKIEVTVEITQEPEGSQIDIQIPESIEFNQAELSDVVFWVPVEYEVVEVNNEAQERIEKAIFPPEPPNIQPPTYHYLSSWAELEPRLRTALFQTINTQRPDISKVVDLLGRGELPASLPYEQRKGWGNSLQVIDDRNRHLAPYLIDHEMVQLHLAQIFPGDSLEVALLDAAFDEPLIYQKEGGFSAYKPPVGRRVLILSDLGVLAQDGGRSRNFWKRFGQRLRAAKCEAIVLLPCSPRQCDPELRLLFKLMSWEHPAPAIFNKAQGEAACEQLLQLLSPTWRFSPGLLRAVRLALGGDKPAALVESLFWQHSATQNLNLTVSAVTFEEGELKKRHTDFEAIDQVLQKRVLNEIRAWHFDLPPEIWYSTLWGLPRKAQVILDSDYLGELEKAQHFLAYIANRSHENSETSLGINARAWVDRNIARLSDSARNNPRIMESVTQLQKAQWRWQKKQVEIEPVSMERLSVSQQGGEFFINRGGKEEGGSYLCDLLNSSSEIYYEPIDVDEIWPNGKVPSWVDVSGQDQYGQWAEFVYKNVRQRMRWIEPGEFLMGSPPDEHDRQERESPQHKVTLEQGYWLFDSACTQALWSAVMGENPSHFKGKNRPVENVSWNDCQQFFNNINQAIPDLELSLPSEAQWEYACRAGTNAPFSFGETISSELVNYNGNYPYRNKDRKGQDRQETLSVKALSANPWGLYQMHGNVLEWVDDVWHQSYESAPADGAAWVEAGVESGVQADAGRVIRGGSWDYDAQGCRSAFRGWFGSGSRGVILGFRPARVQNGSGSSA